MLTLLMHLLLELCRLETSPKQLEVPRTTTATTTTKRTLLLRRWQGTSTQLVVRLVSTTDHRQAFANVRERCTRPESLSGQFVPDWEPCALVRSSELRSRLRL